MQALLLPWKNPLDLECEKFFLVTYTVCFICHVDVSVHNSDPHMWKVSSIFAHHEKNMAEMENMRVDVVLKNSYIPKK